VLQDAGLSCFEYVEQLTLLLFLRWPTSSPSAAPQARHRAAGTRWKALVPLDGPKLEDKYRDILEKLALKPGMLGVIFRAPVRDSQPGAVEAAHRQPD